VEPGAWNRATRTHDVPRPTRPFSAGVLYIPDGYSPHFDSFFKILNHGGLMIEVRFGPSSEPPIKWAPPDSEPFRADANGRPSAVALRWHGAPVVIDRTADKTVMAATYVVGVDGHRLMVDMAGNHTPDAMFGFVRRLQLASPSNEQALADWPEPPTRIPPSTVVPMKLLATTAIG
jgi:hypothetical protein